MDERQDTHASAMESSGMGLLPGITVALAIAVGIIALAMLDSWWVVPVIVLGLAAVTAAVVVVVLAVLEDDPDGPLRHRIPGL